MLSLKKAGVIRQERWLFRGLDLDVLPGEYWLLKGGNGTGKTTLLLTLAGLWPLSEGELSCRSSFHFLPQVPIHIPEFTLKEHLQYLCLIRASHLVHDEQIYQALEAWGLASLAEQSSAQLSQGQKQRLNLAMLSLLQTPLWLLDEPSTSLDKNAFDCLTQVLNQHLARGGSLVMATHQSSWILNGVQRSILENALD